MITSLVMLVIIPQFAPPGVLAQRFLSAHTARIPMQLTDYQQLHTDRDTFVVMPDHQVDPIETVIAETADYNVVQKNNSTPEPTSGLNETSIDNS